jgi:hypothetical protein
MNTQNRPSNGGLQSVGTEPNVTQQQPAMSSSPDQFEKIVDRAHKEIEWVHLAYTRYARIIGAILVTGITIASFLTWNSAREMRSDMKDNMADMSNRVNKRIDDEFNKESIQDLIRKKAEGRVDEVAGGIINDYIVTTLKPKLDTFQSKLSDFNARMISVEDQLDVKISATESRLKALESGALAELRQTSEYIMTVVAAQNDDRKAYDQLIKWQNDKGSPFHERAAQARAAILDEHAAPWSANYTVPWRPEVDPSKLSFDQLKSELLRTPSKQNRIALIEFIWGRGDIPKKDKMGFLVEVMKSDPSLGVVEQAGRSFLLESKQRIKPLVTDQMIDWWEKHKNEYPKEDQPKDSPDKK